MTEAHPRSGGGRRIAAVAAGVLGLAGVVLIGVAVADQVPAPPAPPAASGTSAEPGGTSADDPALPDDADEPAPAPTGETPEGAGETRNPDAAEDADALLLPPSEPVSIRIPSIGVSADPVVDLGLDDEGAMEVPADPALTGWYTGSPTPGEYGPSVLAGHVTWNGAESVFFRLGDMRPGDRVEVDREDGTTAVFEVTDIEQYPKDEFPTLEVYGNTDGSTLRLITCGGDYRADESFYTDNVVVYAELVDSASA
jgi:LPXTG-site transpeptidase (sortase) family protein